MIRSAEFLEKGNKIINQKIFSVLIPEKYVIVLIFYFQDKNRVKFSQSITKFILNDKMKKRREKYEDKC